MGNVLQFSLALEASNFINELGISSRELLSFATVAEGVRIGVEHLSEAINQGAALKGLSSATGESVSELYKFQHGLEAIGADTGNLSETFLLVQRALSGVTDTGQRTSSVLAELGLDINSLRSEDSVTAITDIATALARLNPNQGAGVAEMLFGRYGAQTVLQMAHEMGAFKEGVASGANTGALLDKYATTFRDVKNYSDDIEADFQGVWVAIAGDIAPRLESLFSKIHTEIKDIGPALAGAMQSGHMEEFLSDALNAAFEQGGYYGARIFSALAVGFGDALGTAILVTLEDAIPAAFDKIKNQQAIENAEGDRNLLLAKSEGLANTDTRGMSPAALKALNQKEKAVNAQIDAATQTIANFKNAGSAELRQHFVHAFQTSEQGILTLISDVSKEFNSGAGNRPHTMKDIFDAAIAKYAATFLSGANVPSSNEKKKNEDLDKGPLRPEFTALEKMGFIFSHGINNPYRNQQIALLTRIATGVEKIISPALAHAVNVETSLVLAPLHALNGI